MSKPDRTFIPHKPSGSSVPTTVSRRRRVGYLRFSHPVLLPDVGFIREMTAGTELDVDRPGGRGIGTPIPEMWYLPDESVIVVGTRRFHTGAGIVESWDCGE